MFRRRTKPTEITHLDELQEMTASGKPVLIDFFQHGCGPCKIMDGIVNELAEEFEESAHIVKVNVARVPGAAQAFGVRSTPTFVVLARSQKKSSKKSRRRAAEAEGPGAVSPRWRTSGLVRKDVMTRVLESNGATRST
jgi:thiol-disulfide isomerase/thioredoxin